MNNYRQQSTGVLEIKNSNTGEWKAHKTWILLIARKLVINYLLKGKMGTQAHCITDIIIENSPKSNKLFRLSEKKSLFVSLNLRKNILFNISLPSPKRFVFVDYHRRWWFPSFCEKIKLRVSCWWDIEPAERFSPNVRRVIFVVVDWFIKKM